MALPSRCRHQPPLLPESRSRVSLGQPSEVAFPHSASTAAQSRPQWPTLLLNASFEPLRVISWQRALRLCFGGKVDVVVAYADRVRSPSLALSVPAVVRLHRYVSWRERAPRFSRTNVLRRDLHTCQYCGSGPDLGPLTMDHVVPRAQGGPTTWENIVTACEPCNRRKGDRTPTQARMPLARQPKPARWLPASRCGTTPTAPPPEWSVFLGAA